MPNLVKCYNCNTLFSHYGIDDFNEFEPYCTECQDKTFECVDCSMDVTENDFESIDDELNLKTPRCPACQKQQRIIRHVCENCDLPAEYEVDYGYLCSEHHSDYVDGYIRD